VHESGQELCDLAGAPVVSGSGVVCLCASYLDTELQGVRCSQVVCGSGYFRTVLGKRNQYLSTVLVKYVVDQGASGKDSVL
jgi:hypothetical protein